MLHESTRIGIQGTSELDVISTYGRINDNGLVMQAAYEGGRRKCRPSNAAANSMFVGFSKGIIGSGPPSSLVQAEVVHTNASGVAMLSAPAAAGAATVVPGTSYGSAPYTQTASPTTAPTTDTQFQLGGDNQTLTFSTNNANRDFFVIYTYSPTVDSVRWTYGDFIPGNNAPALFGRIGVIFDGLVVTDKFDPAVNWAAVTDSSAGNILRGGANGLVTIGGSGCVIPGKVAAIPSSDLPFLSLAIGEHP